MPKTVLVTGSSKGLGKELALIFSKNKYNVILHGRDINRLIEVKKEVLKNGVDCCFVAGDLTRESTIDNLSYCAKRFGIDILINNAGSYSNKTVSATDPKELRNLFEVNVIAPILLTKQVFGLLKKKGSGLIININSFAGKNPSEGEAVYSATKYALHGFSSSFRYEALNSNVVISDFFLGAMDTDITTIRQDREKLMKTKEVAEVIYSAAKDYLTLRLSEMDILRRIY